MFTYAGSKWNVSKDNTVKGWTATEHLSVVFCVRRLIKFLLLTLKTCVGLLFHPPRKNWERNCVSIKANDVSWNCFSTGTSTQLPSWISNQTSSLNPKKASSLTCTARGNTWWGSAAGPPLSWSWSRWLWGDTVDTLNAEWVKQEDG